MVELDDGSNPGECARRILGPAAKLSATPARLRRPSPLYGEHTREVLREIGHGDAEIDDLARLGVVFERPPPRPETPR